MIKPKVVIKTPNTAIPWGECIAKTRIVDGVNVCGHTVSTHCQIVGRVAGELVNRWPKNFQREMFPKGFDLVAASHDLGKISPTFQAKILRSTKEFQENPRPELEGVNFEIEKNWGGHAGTSQATVEGVGKYIPEILGSHHGKLLQPNRLPHDQSLGGEVWQKEREKLIDVLKKSFMTDWPTIQTHEQFSLLSGLTTVADWVGSGSFFEDQNNKLWPNLIPKAVDEAGFITPKIKKGLEFGDIFNGYKPKEAQTQFVKLIVSPGVYVLEAPMGMGKTEAALFAIYKALEEERATGFYFALPTQLTSNKIIERVDEFLENILDSTSAHKKAFLLHGSAWLKGDIGEEGEPGRSWFSSIKRSILAPFGVGTIDQALMAVLNVKHSTVRAYGLAGKVVVLDEVHTYDTYTGTVLNQLVQTLVALNCTVIILSATLTKSRKNELIPANNHGGLDAYPLVSAYPKGKGVIEIPINPEDLKKVQVTTSTNVKDTIEEALLRVDQGQQVLWIENTVKEAQDLYLQLVSRLGAMNLECGLLHSRFVKVDRQHNEDRWVNLYGVNGYEQRNKGRLLIGTQVLEQSLDIDADFLITKICPTDLLLQRIGRLWRHSKNHAIRPVDAVCQVWVLCPELQDAILTPKQAMGSSAYLNKAKGVYAAYVLCRSIEVVKKLQTIEIPSQMRELIENTYSDRDETDEMAYYKQEIEDNRKKLQGLALVGLSGATTTLSDENPTTRYSEQSTSDVLLLKKYSITPNGIEIQLYSDETITFDNAIKFKHAKNRKEIAIKLAENTLSVPVYMAPDAILKKNLEWLAPYMYLGDESESLVRVGVVDKTETIQSIFETKANGCYQLRYNKEIGYYAKKASGEVYLDDEW